MEENNSAVAEIDFSPLLVPAKKFAIRCETEAEAKWFIEAVITQFPEKETLLTPEDNHWANELYDCYGGVAYYPDLNYAEHEKFMWGDVQYAKDHGYTLIYFKDLLATAQTIDESDMPLGMLFEI